MSRLAEILPGVCFGVGFANFLLFGAYVAEGRIEWGYYALGVVLLTIFTAYWTVQKSRKKVA
jgi:uncharacterized membrane protein YiaA